MIACAPGYARSLRANLPLKKVLSALKLKNSGKYFVKFSISNCMKIHLSVRDFYKRRQAGRQTGGIYYFNRQSARIQKGLTPIIL